MRQHFFLSLLFLGLFLAVSPAFAEQVCFCQITASEGGCSGTEERAINFSTELSLRPLLESVQGSNCTLPGPQVETEELDTPFTVSATNCGSLSLNGGQDGYEYSLSCRVRETEEPTVTGGTQEVHLINPIQGTKEKPKGIVDWNIIIGKIIETATGILGSVALIVFAYGGFQWLLSRGNSEMISKGLNTMIYAALGLCIIFGSYAILSLVFQGLESAAR